MKIQKAQRSLAKIKLAISGPTGCLTGDTVVNLNSSGKGYKQSLEKLYKLSLTRKQKRKIRTYNAESGLIELRPIKNVFYSGIKNVFLLKTQTGKTIKATSCHRILTKNGYKKLSDITTSDWVIIDYLKPLKKITIKPTNNDSNICGLKYHPFARLINSKRDGKFKSIEKHRAIYEAYLNNLTLEEYVNILKTNLPALKKMKFINPKTHHIHHIDGNHYNNDVDNLSSLTIKEHAEVHRKDFVFNLKTWEWDRVASIEAVGSEKTYDIEIDDSLIHNFVANGIVVHNSGKTYSALRLAKGLGKKIGVIDTENNSASLYADKFDFDVISLGPPYTIEKYIEAIEAFLKENYDVLIIDSISHAWAGEGGLLQKKEQLDSRPGGNSYTNWAKMTPLQEKFVSHLLHSPINLIVTMRSKMAYELVDDNGKKKPVKMGLAPIQRDGIEYEFTTLFDVAQNHETSVSKDRTGLFVDKIFQITEDTGKQISEWLASGKPVIDFNREIINKIISLKEKLLIDQKLKELTDLLGEQTLINSNFILNLSESNAKKCLDYLNNK